jgi:hypothetical protein
MLTIECPTLGDTQCSDLQNTFFFEHLGSSAVFPELKWVAGLFYVAVNNVEYRGFFALCSSSQTEPPKK